MKLSRLFLVRNGCIALVSLLSSVISLAAPHSQLTYIFDTIRKVEDSVVQANLLRGTLTGLSGAREVEAPSSWNSYRSFWS